MACPKSTEKKARLVESGQYWRPACAFACLNYAIVLKPTTA